jgi:hypothetical protein
MMGLATTLEFPYAFEFAFLFHDFCVGFAAFHQSPDVVG